MLVLKECHRLVVAEFEGESWLVATNACHSTAPFFGFYSVVLFTPAYHRNRGLLITVYSLADPGDINESFYQCLCLLSLCFGSCNPIQGEGQDERFQGDVC